MSEQMAADRVTTNELMIDALSVVWNELAFMMGDDWATMKKALLEDLAQMDQMEDVSADYVPKMLMQHLGKYPYALDMINDAYANMSGKRMADMDAMIAVEMAKEETEETEESETAEPETAAESETAAQPEAATTPETDENFFRVPVFFATNRKRDKRFKAQRSFTGKRGNEMHYGIAEVSMPKTHVPGKLEAPSRWRREKADPARHILVLSIESLDDGSFITRANQTLADEDTEDSALIFIHGYGTSFGGALRITAQVATDLEFKGIPITYSWPSHAKLLKYTADEANAKHGQAFFDDFLEMVVTKLNVKKIHILAHSMGNRLATLGMQNLKDELGDKLGQVIFASPDVDKDVFSQRAAKFAGKADRYTLYINENDLALELSQFIHGFARAGERDEDPLVVSPVETIDATNIDGSFLGHSFYQKNRTVMADIMSLVMNNLAPDDRPNLLKKGNANFYWEMLK